MKAETCWFNRTRSEAAQLRSAEASMELARLNLERAKELLPENVITRSNYDSVEAEFKQAAAQVDAIRATIAKKTIRAPFAGRLGLRLINLGQTLNDGDTHRFPAGHGSDFRQFPTAPAGAGQNPAGFVGEADQ